jgi:ubiquinone/menaquinone biosynthesis C-methylase UbiE
MMRWLRKPVGDPLAVSMSGIKLGDRLLVLGASDTSLVAALASKAGLTGRACLVDESDDLRSRAAVAIEREGVLLESFCAPLASLPFDAESFDVVLFRNVLRAAEPASQQAALAEAKRVVRPGGRCIVIDDAPRSGIGALVGGDRKAPRYPDGGAAALVTAAGFRGVRTLAEREGLVFVEGVKAGT